MEKQLILRLEHVIYKINLGYLVAQKIRKCSKTKLMGYVKGTQESAERAPTGYLMSKINNIVLDYNPKSKINNSEPCYGLNCILPRPQIIC